MKKILVTGMVILVLGLSLSLAACSEPNAFVSTQQQGIWVTGTGKVTATPDLATINLGIEAQEDSVSAAQNRASTAMDAVLNALRSQGLADKDIQTQRFDISQVTRYDQATQQQVIIGYRVSNIVTAKVHNIDGVGAVIDAAARAGGDLTRVNNISLTVEDPTQYYNEARTKAIADALQKAEQLANLTGVTMEKPIYISEATLSTPPPILGSIGAIPAPAPAPQTPISPGEEEITLNIQVAYEISD